MKRQTLLFYVFLQLIVCTLKLNLIYLNSSVHIFELPLDCVCCLPSVAKNNAANCNNWQTWHLYFWCYRSWSAVFSCSWTERMFFRTRPSRLCGKYRMGLENIMTVSSLYVCLTILRRYELNNLDDENILSHFFHKAGIHNNKNVIFAQFYF